MKENLKRMKINENSKQISASAPIYANWLRVNVAN
jgi:hypothetical protein